MTRRIDGNTNEQIDGRVKEGEVSMRMDK